MAVTPRRDSRSVRGCGMALQPRAMSRMQKAAPHPPVSQAASNPLRAIGLMCIAWALFAFVLLLVGIRRRSRIVRYASLGLLGVALLKLFLHDLANLNHLYRIGAFAAVAVIAIVASFLSQRFLTTDDRPTESASAPADETH